MEKSTDERDERERTKERHYSLEFLDLAGSLCDSEHSFFMDFSVSSIIGGRRVDLLTSDELFYSIFLIFINSTDIY